MQDKVLQLEDEIERFGPCRRMCDDLSLATNPPFSEMTLRLCYLVAPGLLGGLERVVHGLTKGLAARGHDVHVFAVLVPSPKREPFVAAFDDSAVTVHELRLPPGLRYFAAERRAARALFASLRPDVVHSHGFRPDLLDAGIARRLGTPIATTIHGESFMGGRTRLYEWLQWRTYRRFDAVIAVSAHLRDTALSRRVRPDCLHLIRNAWPGGVTFASRDAARRELGLAPGELAVGWLGRMIPVKGADVFLRAMAELGGSSAAATLIGDGSERSKLEALAAELGLRSRVRFVGGIEGGARLLPAFDAFVLSSRSEGTPIVLFEAMAAGVPIVASRVGGVPDVVGDRAAVLVPADDPAALAQALRQVLEAPQARVTMVQDAHRRLAGNFGTADWLNRHEALYRALVARGSPRR
jgi:glycosyltransferase involved in cell wall biosynthesis